MNFRSQATLRFSFALALFGAGFCALAQDAAPPPAPAPVQIPAPQAPFEAPADPGPMQPFDVFGAPSAAGAEFGDVPDPALGPDMPSDAIIQYDPETDSIMVITDDATASAIDRIVQTLDQPVPQVLIKVLFLEVTHSDDLDFGVSAEYIGNTSVDQATGLPDTRTDTVSTLFGNPLQGGFYRIVSDDFNATLHALQRVGKIEVLSRPSILARNNQPALITIGQQVPIPNNQRVSDSGVVTSSVTYRDVGIILNVTPHITADGLVEMYVAPEISSLTDSTVQISEDFNAPIINRRAAETNVIVEDGKTVVIGGLMQDSKESRVSQVPILGSIPIVGNLFKRTIRAKDKTELLIFLTPFVVNTMQRLDEVSVQENNQAELPPRIFSPSQRGKFIDNLPEGAETWTGTR